MSIQPTETNLFLDTTSMPEQPAPDMLPFHTLPPLPSHKAGVNNPALNLHDRLMIKKMGQSLIPITKENNRIIAQILAAESVKKQRFDKKKEDTSYNIFLQTEIFQPRKQQSEFIRVALKTIDMAHKIKEKT